MSGAHGVRFGRQPDAIVVGHSLGGFTIPHIEARARGYVAALPTLTRDEIDECFAEGFGGTMRDTLNRTVWPDAHIAATRMYPDCHSRPCGMPHSTPAGRFARPAATARA